MQAQLKTAHATTRPRFLIELAKPTQDKIVFRKFPTLQKNKKRNAQPILNDTTTQQLQWFTSTDDKNHWLE
ncbi:MAG TPA: hypothetical protein VLZ83_01810 [Edaphocola sp.]|nr:hypothetical protein [Edaphocola sp.]